MKSKNTIGQKTKRISKIIERTQHPRLSVKLDYPITSQIKPPPCPLWKKLSTGKPHIQHQ